MAIERQEVERLLRGGGAAGAAVERLTDRAVAVPPWGGAEGLQAQYEPRLHPVMNRALYPDRPDGRGGVERVTRVALNFQRLAAKRLAELCVGTPVKRIYTPNGAAEGAAAAAMEAVFTAARIDSVNTERALALFAGCEAATLWYAVPEAHARYGFKSSLRLRCRTFSPLTGDRLFPLFDAYGDMVALGVMQTLRAAGGAGERRVLDVYSESTHAVFTSDRHGWQRGAVEAVGLGKIPAAYVWRPAPAWEDTSPLVYEMEWTLSRNGNYLRKNSKPLFTVFADEEIPYGGERDADSASRAVLQFPKGSSAGYVTWPQAVESLKFHMAELRQLFFTQLQLPDWSYESMKSAPMSGESRRQLFIDAHLKVLDERGRLQEFFDREVNVVRAFLKGMLPPAQAEAVQTLGVRSVVTPFALDNEGETLANLMRANGGKPIVSQREAIERLGWSGDAARTLAELQEEARAERMAEAADFNL